MNEHYIKNIDENDLFNFLITYCETFQEKIDDLAQKKIKNSLHFLKNKAKTLEDIYKNSKFLINDKDFSFDIYCFVVICFYHNKTDC